MTLHSQESHRGNSRSGDSVLHLPEASIYYISSSTDSISSRQSYNLTSRDYFCHLCTRETDRRLDWILESNAQLDYLAGEIWVWLQVALSKPAGLQVLPGGLFQQRTVLTQLQWRDGGRAAEPQASVPSPASNGSCPTSPVHRLGRGTSGRIATLCPYESHKNC